MKYLAFLTLILALSACSFHIDKDSDVEAQAGPVRPEFASIRTRVFLRKCVQCHSPGNHHGAEEVSLELQALLDSDRDLILPGEPEKSGLLIALTRQDEKRMPPQAKGYPRLKDEEISAIREWIQTGAKP